MGMFWKLRLGFQWFLTFCGLNGILKLVQFCERCGRSGAKWLNWWADTELWDEVTGNRNGFHHGCYCPSCFTSLCNEKGIWIIWKPERQKFNDPNNPDSELVIDDSSPYAAITVGEIRRRCPEAANPWPQPLRGGK
jgi:hypothetical protein